MPISTDHQKQFWDSVVERRDPSHPAVSVFAREKIKIINTIIDRNSSNINSLLEIGCGNGYFSVYLKDHYDVLCVDFSINMLKLNPLPDQNKIVGIAEQLSFSDSSFDIVFCANLLHHLENPLKAVLEMKRISRKFVILIEPNALNPAMFLFSLIKKEERGALKFTGGHLRALGCSSGMRLIYSKNQGVIVPNKTPKMLVPMLSIFDGVWPLGLYSIAIFKK